MVRTSGFVRRSRAARDVHPRSLAMLDNKSALASAAIVTTTLGLLACGAPSPAGGDGSSDSGAPALDAGAPIDGGTSSDAPGEASSTSGDASAVVDAGPGGIHIGATSTIMTFGDSITAATCWRARFWEELQAHAYTKLRMVGSQDTSGNCSDAGHNEGHSGYLLTNLANEEPNGEMDTWFSANPPDVLLMHFGTNDVWNKIPTNTILGSYGVAIDTVRKYSPNVVIVLAQIIPMNPSNCPSCAAGVQQLDAAIPAWAAGKSTTSSPIVVVDQWTGFDDSTDTGDGVHPNATTGSQKMADKWWSALAPML
jgi:lysophospholipase L1-like esterase